MQSCMRQINIDQPSVRQGDQGGGRDGIEVVKTEIGVSRDNEACVPQTRGVADDCLPELTVQGRVPGNAVNHLYIYMFPSLPQTGDDMESSSQVPGLLLQWII